MRIAIIILATLLLLGTAGLGLLATKKTLTDASDVEEIYGPMKAEIAAMAKAGDASAKELQSIGESTGKMKAGGVALGVVALLAIALVVMMFLGKGVPQLALGIVAVGLIAIVLSPQYDTGPTGGASARNLAYIVGAIGALGAAAAYGAKALGDKRA